MRLSTARKIIKTMNSDYERIAFAFSETRNRIWPEVRSILENYVEPGQTLLEVGCGNGRLWPLIAERDVEYFGVDRVKSFIESCQEKYCGTNDNPRFEVADALDLPFHQPRFDVVLLFAVLNHFPSHEMRLQVLENIFHCLKPGGFLLMTNWNLWRFTLKEKSIWHFWREKQHLSVQEFEKRYLVSPSEYGFKDIMTHWGEKEKPGHLYYYAFTLKELRSLVKDAGFQNIVSYYAKNGQRSHVWSGHNSIIMATKN